MKTKFFLYIAVLFSIFCQYSCDVNTVGAICKDIARDALEMGAVYAADKSLQTLGASTEESKQLINDFTDIVDGHNANIDRGLNISRSDDYQKQQMALDIVENNTIVNSNNPAIKIWFDAARSNLQYGHDKARAKTQEEKIQAEVDFAMRTSDIFYDAYQRKKTLDAERLSQKLEIVEQLKKSGNYNPECALEVAGYILSVAKSKDLTEEEKDHLLRDMGFYQDNGTIKSMVTEVTSPNYVDNDIIVEKTLPEQPLLQKPDIQNSFELISRELESIKVDNYKLNAINLSEEQRNELNKVVDILKQNNAFSILLIGHTCDLGNDVVNTKIGRERALSVKEYLISKGISESRISIESKGETQPLVPNTSEDNQRKNRRVEIVLNN